MLWIQGLQKGRIRVTMVGLTELVDFVEHNDRVHDLGLAQGGHDLARHRADVGLAVALNLGDVIDTA